MSHADNERLAERLHELADLLEGQEANPYRVAAWRRAARSVAVLDELVAERLAREGLEGLERIPGVGHRIALALAELVRTGRWHQLERLRGEHDPERAFQTLPGVGPTLARRLHEDLDVDTLEELELAAHDGRLEQVPGVGPRRARMIAAELEQQLRRRARRPVGDEPPVSVLLDVDRAYREAAAAGALPRIAPRRFNPDGAAWLPILHTARGDWQLTALFSNTARAHELGRTSDWVVLYFHRGDGPEGRRTVVTETHGPLEGRRVVRGREAECADHHAV